MVDENDNPVQRFKLQRKLTPEHKKAFLISAVPCILMIIFLMIISSQVKKAGIIIQEDMKNSTTFIHDTVLVQPPKIFHCWQCKNELKGLNQGPVKCCGFEYTIKKGELFGKKLDEQ